MNNSIFKMFSAIFLLTIIDVISKCNGQNLTAGPQYGVEKLKDSDFVLESAEDSSDLTKSERDEKFRTALIDAFQAIKSASNKNSDVDGYSNFDLFPSISSQDPAEIKSEFLVPEHRANSDDFDSFFDSGDGLFSDDVKKTENASKDTKMATEMKNENVQHIISMKNKKTNLMQTSSSIKITTSIPYIEEPTVSAIIRTDLFAKNNSVDYNFVGIDNILTIFDAKLLLKEWTEVQWNVSSKCHLGIDKYIQGLKVNEIWALKMDDASGRYTSAFFWGNNYWTGSAQLCNSLNEKTTASSKNGSAVDESNITGSESWRQINARQHARPPFSAAFYMLRLQISSPVTALLPKSRIIHLGLCLPFACSPADVGTIVTSLPRPAVHIKLLATRSLSYDRYDFSEDLTFQLLFGFSIATACLLFAGTAYDILLTSRTRARRDASRSSRGTLNDEAHIISGNKPQNSGHKLEMGLSNVTMNDGKSMYSVNNNTNRSEEQLTVDSVSSDSQDEQIQLSIFSELILSFSLVANIRTIFDQSVGNDSLPTVHGLRSISMLWVILGHTCIVAFKYSDNTEVRKIVEKEFLFQTVLNGAYSVDTFFCLSGLLVAFIYFRTNAKGSLDRLTQGRRGFTSGFLQFWGLIGYRFARLTIPYIFMLGVTEVANKWFAHNSVFEPPTEDHINCPKYWWRNILYINTLFPVEQMCMLWSWYLADDSQFYALGAIMLILATSHFKLASISMVMFMVSSWITTGYISWINNHVQSSDDPLALFDKIYDKPWTRLGPYLVGMITGWILFKTNCTIRMSKYSVTFGWVMSSGALLFLVYGLYDTTLSQLPAAIFTSLSHSVWAAAIGWIIIACSTGYGGFVNTLLSTPILYPFSRVTYCAYLVHPIVIRFLAMHLDHPLHLGKDIMTIIFFGQVIASYVISFIISVSFEAPIVTMLKILSPHKKPRKI